MSEHNDDSISDDIPYFTWSYCTLVGFFAQDAEVQRTQIPSRCEPTYTTFSTGDGDSTWPLEIMFERLRDAAVSLSYLSDESEVAFVEESLNENLLDIIRLIYERNEIRVTPEKNEYGRDRFRAAFGDDCGEDNFFGTGNLSTTPWTALRAASNEIGQALDEAHRLSFENWRDYTG